MMMISGAFGIRIHSFSSNVLLNRQFGSESLEDVCQLLWVPSQNRNKAEGSLRAFAAVMDFLAHALLKTRLEVEHSRKIFTQVVNSPSSGTSRSLKMLASKTKLVKDVKRSGTGAYCAAVNCNNNRKSCPNLQFYRFPSDESR